MNNFPCTYCNHVLSRHFKSLGYEGTICLSCVTLSIKNIDSWHDYKADNLKYLEQLYEDNHK